MHTVHIFIYLCLLVFVCVIHFPFSATNMKKQMQNLQNESMLGSKQIIYISKK